MTRSITRSLTAGLFSVALGALGLAILEPAWAADHEGGEGTVALKTWDQAAIGSLADKLQHQADGLRKEARNRPPEPVGSGQTEGLERYQNTLRSMESEARRLKLEVEAGKGRDDTLNIFKRIDELRRDADEEARRLFLPKATIDSIQASRATLEELRLYYTGTVDDRPDLVGPSKDKD